MTNERDITSDYIVIELRKRKLNFRRLNSERLSQAHIDFTPSSGEDSWNIRFDEEVIDFSKVRSAYFRRPGIPTLATYFNSPMIQKYCESEWGASLSSALYSLGARWLNSPGAIRDAENKPRQLAIAHAIGFRVPETIVTNDPAKAFEFVSMGPSVGKPLKESLVGFRESEKVIFTSRIIDIEKNYNESVSSAPIIYQREIRKRADIRATVIGQKVYAAEILSQEYKETEVDWRKGSNPNLRHNIHRLPNEIIKKCLAIINKLNLRFGAIDLILDQQDRYWFLEVNPNGQWAWIENRTGLPLTRAIVDELERIAG